MDVSQYVTDTADLLDACLNRLSHLYPSGSLTTSLTIQINCDP
jgi:hypothetical protein